MTGFPTISDSKKAFHTAFPYVIPSLYRRIADELLVELHLLSHQTNFQVNALFAVGLRQVFRAFTKGYRPEEQVEPMFAALCSCNGFDAEDLKALAEGSTKAVQGHSVEDVQAWLNAKGDKAPEPLASGLAALGGENFHYSRLMAVGLFSLLSDAQGSESDDPEALSATAHALGEQIGLSRPRLEKDLSLYRSNLDKMTQAVELMEETLAAERRKRERQQAEKVSQG
ncbi:photosystem II biogenesis protein Psp29 [Synechococcus sp. NOUM97013]|uniref:photosystem II biogenesis protein Psp29 n=1 Tax=Synechococcus sp. NOUM97013 TaxID=1442555 RepID=UPI00185FF4D3|nr:photosystem II biogenesis protein Psp29 [Synechococcus sp. NOUM97013]QNI73543.1 photosystem II repair protein Psb29 [Synechococcus sp. NOUM97013]